MEVAISGFTLGCGGLGVWWICAGPHSHALVPLPTCRQADRSIVPTLESPCPQSLTAGLQEQQMGSSVLAGACMAACVKHFGGSEISRQGDSYMGFSLTFWRVQLGRCLGFSPLTALTPQLPSEISMRHPCNDSAFLGDPWGISSTSPAAISL